MKIINNVKQITGKKYYITIGNFDGVHLGHQKLLQKVVKLGHQSIVYTFSPHPQLFFKNNDFNVLTTQKEKLYLFNNQRVDYVFIIASENKTFNLTPKQFVEKYFPHRDNVAQIIIGEDFRFGKDRRGSITFLSEFFGDNKIQIVSDIKNKKTRISSSLLRRDILDMKLKNYYELTGTRYFFYDKISSGQRNGTKIGFPTININIDSNKLTPKPGVYISKTYINALVYLSISNIGFNPTINSKTKTKRIETYILNAVVSAPVDNIKVELVSFIRCEKKFSNINDLKNQITNDLLELNKCYI